MKKKQNYIYILIMLLVLVSIGFIRLPRLGKEVSTSSVTAYSVTDSSGYTLHFERKPERILSLSLSTDEILTDLVTEERIIGLSQWSDVATIANNYDQTRNIKNRLRSNNVEQIMALQPDLVLVTSFFDQELLAFLRGLGLKIYVYPTLTTIEGVKTSIQDLGRALGEDDKSLQLTKQMDAKLALVAERLKDIPVKDETVLHMEGDLAYYSKDIALNDICRYAGAQNVTQKLASQSTRFLSKEEIVALNPKVFIVTDWDFDGNNDPQKMIDVIKNDAAYSTLDAVKNNRIYAIKGKHLLATSQYIVDAVEDLAKVIYPQAFAKHS